MTSLKQFVKDELSGETAKSYVNNISQFHRIQASTMFHEAAEYVRDTLQKIGYEDIKIEQFTSDGLKKYWTWTTPIGWEVDDAELHLLKPEVKLIVRYKDTPTSLHAHSKSTPAKGITAELVDVGEGTKPEHYKKKDVKGKFVLATGRAKAVHEIAVYKHGAAGVITDTITYEIKDVRESIDIPDAHAYQAIWPTKKELAKIRFGFSISKRQGNNLRKLLTQKEPVVLKAKVKTRIFPGKLDVVTATIKGESKEEIVLIAHLCHPKPSANDNASGSGLLLEIARTLKRLTETSRVEKPQRTIRFLWVPEFYGSIAYFFHHKNLISRFSAGINLDMVGQNQEFCRSTLNLDKTPDSNPSFINDYIFHLFEESVKEFDPGTSFGSSSTFRYSKNAFSGGSDHAVFNDSTFRVPCIMLIQWPDMYYHTSMDSIDKVSEKSLKRVGWIAAVTALTLSNITEKEAAFMINLVRHGGITRLIQSNVAATRSLTLDNLKDASLTKKLAETKQNFQRKIAHITWREKKALESITKFNKSPAIKELIKEYSKDIDLVNQLERDRFDKFLKHVTKKTNITPKQKSENKKIENAKKIIPTRNIKGPLNMDALKRALGAKEYEWYEEVSKKDKDFRKKGYEILNFIDGKRNVYDITGAVSAEYTETNLETVTKFIMDLEKVGFISISKKRSS